MKNYASIFFVFILIITIAHQALKYRRYSVTQFGEKPAELMTRRTRAIFKTLELDLAPSLMIFTLAAVLGMFKFFLALLMALSFVGGFLICMGYENEETNQTNKYVKIGRIIIVVSCFMTFLTILISSKDIGTAIKSPID